MGIIYKNGIVYGNQPSIDATLTQEGEAADAKATGDALAKKAPVIYDTASGSIASFPDGADGLPVKNLTVGIEPVQSGTGDPSPDNVRPISGWTGCNISHSGADTSDPTVIPITFPTSAGTVYGGTLDVTSGVLTVDMGGIMFDLTGRDYTTSNGLDSYLLRLPFETLGGLLADKKLCNVCGLYAYAGLTVTEPHFYMANNLFMIYLEENTYRTGTVQVTAPLATPITYQLTPTEILLLAGENNVWADTGDTTVTYCADTKLYIQKINAPTDDDMTADAQIASGKYFIIGGNLYRSTTTIPAGDTINPGTNCILTNLAEALNALNA